MASGPLNYTTSFARRWKLERVLIKATQNISETITITLDSKQGSAFDTILASQTLDNENDFVYNACGENNYLEGDEIKIECTNANLIGVLSGMIKTSEM